MPLLEILFLFSSLLLAVFGSHSLFLAGVYRRQGPYRSQKHQNVQSEVDSWPTKGAYPFVTIQLPVFNERHVVKRLIQSAVNMQWPVERLQIQILDDSTDDTQQLIAASVQYHQSQNVGLQIEHAHRTNRQGFKGGALQNGLTTAQGEFIAIFDADFVPPPDFLKKTIPLFKDEKVGCVQTRWGHINPNSSQLTKAQSVGIDGHFVVEQEARHILNVFLNFNGTAGVWRRTCIDDAGGWQGDTLTEDLDLSYRAQFQGWQIVYRGDVIVFAELPVQLNAFKRQQFRWAKGSIQTALKLMIQLWRTPQSPRLKIMGTLHLTNYLVHPGIILNLLLTLPMIYSDSPLLILTGILTITAIGPPFLYWTALQSQNVPKVKRLQNLIWLIAIGIGLSLNNTRAVLEALLNVKSEFKRTPKFAVIDQTTRWQSSTYTLPRESAVWLELSLATYAIALVILAITLGTWWVIFLLTLYAYGYGYVATLAFIQAWEKRKMLRLKTQT